MIDFCLHRQSVQFSVVEYKAICYYKRDWCSNQKIVPVLDDGQEGAGNFQEYFTEQVSL